jgi:hypothetical protein
VIKLTKIIFYWLIFISLSSLCFSLNEVSDEIQNDTTNSHLSTDIEPNPNSSLSDTNNSSLRNHPNTQIKTSVTQLAETLFEEALWLEIPNGKVMALFRPNFSTKTKGGVVILTSLSPSQPQPPSLHSLQKNLPYHGWETLLVDTTAISSTSVSAEPSTDAHLLNILKSSLSFMSNKKNFNLVVMMDNSIAPELMTHLGTSIGKKNKNGKLDGIVQMVVMINTQNNHQLSYPQLKTLFQQQDLPFIDVFFLDHKAAPPNQAKHHKAIANNQQKKNYYQIFSPTVPAPVAADTYNHFVNRIRGILDRIAKGVELEGVVIEDP